MPTVAPSTLALTEPVPEGWRSILTPEALAFVAELARFAAPRRDELLEARRAAQARYDRGELPRFSVQTEAIRASPWKVAPPPRELLDRRVELTGPVDRKMIINALNSGANVFMADFEDANAPTWANVVEGQLNVRDAADGTIAWQSPETGRTYTLGPHPAVLMVRPRGWHLPEKHALLDGEPVSASIFDFGLFVYHCARPLLRRGSGPYVYLPKLEHHLEARLWDEVCARAELNLGLGVGTIRTTVLIETLPAAFQMDEILWELRRRAVGLNCGRWDYIFSWIKTLRAHPDRVLPDRADETMDQPFLRAYAQQLIRVCHRRGAHAMGGMAAQIPIKGDPDRNEAALAQVRADKQREVADGHDGTWVAHPGLVGLARDVFDAVLTGPNQLDRLRPDAVFTEAELLATPTGHRTLAGLRHDVRVGVAYLEAWLRGIGCVPLEDRMEDAATAEISRALVWQWLRHGVTLDDGTRVDVALVRRAVDDAVGDRRGTGRFDEAAALFLDLCTSPELTDFLTLPAYDHLT